MAHEDFDLESLATYLHLAPAQVSRLADRGKLPGRKVQGQWRFSRSEVHHWLENRIGLSDDDELAQVEQVLHTGGDVQIVVARMLPLEAVAVPLAARTRNSVIKEMVDLAAHTGLLWDTQKMMEAVQAREGLHPTALDNGVALLHPRRPMPNILGEAFLALGVTSQGIPFGSESGRLTDIFFLICSTAEREHLRLLARLSRLLSDLELLDGLRQARSPSEAHARLTECESRLFGLN